MNAGLIYAEEIGLDVQIMKKSKTSNEAKAALRSPATPQRGSSRNFVSKPESLSKRIVARTAEDKASLTKSLDPLIEAVTAFDDPLMSDDNSAFDGPLMTEDNASSVVTSVEDMTVVSNQEQQQQEQQQQQQQQQQQLHQEMDSSEELMSMIVDDDDGRRRRRRESSELMAAKEEHLHITISFKLCRNVMMLLIAPLAMVVFGVFVNPRFHVTTTEPPPT